MYMYKGHGVRLDQGLVSQGGKYFEAEETPREI